MTTSESPRVEANTVALLYSCMSRHDAHSPYMVELFRWCCTGGCGRSERKELCTKGFNVEKWITL